MAGGRTRYTVAVAALPSPRRVTIVRVILHVSSTIDPLTRRDYGPRCDQSHEPIPRDRLLQARPLSGRLSVRLFPNRNCGHNKMCTTGPLADNYGRGVRHSDAAYRRATCAVAAQRVTITPIERMLSSLMDRR